MRARHGLVSRMIACMPEWLMKLCPGFGENLGHDGKAISYKKLLGFSGKSSEYVVSRLP